MELENLSNQFQHSPSVFRVGVEARVRGEGARRGAVLAEVRLHRHALPLRLPQPFVRIQVRSDTTETTGHERSLDTMQEGEDYK